MLRLKFLLQDDIESARETELEIRPQDLGYQQRHLLLDRVWEGKVWCLECAWEEYPQTDDIADIGIQPKIRVPETLDQSRLIVAGQPNLESLIDAVQSDEQSVVEELASVGCKRFSGYFEEQWVQADRRVAVLNRKDHLLTDYREPRMAYHVYLRLVARRVASMKELRLLEWRLGEWHTLDLAALGAEIKAVPVRG